MILLDQLLTIEILDYLVFIFYGIIRGLTEFIPVSSTAHLKIISQLLGINHPGPSLYAIIQIGSVLAILWYFRKNILELYNKKSFNNNNSFFFNKLCKSIFIGTIPIVFVGGIIKLFIPGFFNSFLRSNLSIAILSLLMSLSSMVTQHTY